MTSSKELTIDRAPRLFESAVLLHLTGFVLISYGLKAAYAAHFLNDAAVAALGVLLMAAGIFRAIPGYLRSTGGAGVFGLMLGLPAVTVGLALSLSPGMSAATYSSLIAGYLLANGVMGVLVARRLGATWLRGQSALGVLSLALALMVVTDWPIAELWGVSLALGISLLADGGWLMRLGARNWREARRIEISEKGEGP